MRVLCACEESQAVCIEFRNRGHEAYSCDIQECSGGHPEWHIQGDVLPVLKEHWDLIIAFPPCTYLCVPGAHYLHKNNDRWEKMKKAKDFFMIFYNHSCEKIAIENPVPHKYSELPKYNQIIHPYYFGDEYTKRTCLWLKGLPVLYHNREINLFDQKITHVKKSERYIRKDGTVSNSIWYAKASQKLRSKTFPGIARAMAEQWG